ncbi:MAG: hypothetical protein KDC24_08010 [Saprospiraceae bacterium]|nr:hypothetical protein [Saprospiraceae bacterium]
MIRINIWSSPRNISTAMMYSFGNRPDTSVVDEPLYAHFLYHQQNRPAHPGEEEILQSQANDGNEVVKSVLQADYPTPIVLFKQMTHHLLAIDWSFILAMKNILLIRNPAEIIQSYAKVIPNPSMEDVGITKQKVLYDFLLNNGQQPVIIDTNEVLKNPTKVLAELCHQLSIPFDTSMLQWEAGPRKEDGIWAPYWYQNVHRSTGFQPYEKKEIQLSDELMALAQEAMPVYEFLYEKAIMG